LGPGQSHGISLGTRKFVDITLVGYLLRPRPLLRQSYREALANNA